MSKTLSKTYCDNYFKGRDSQGRMRFFFFDSHDGDGVSSAYSRARRASGTGRIYVYRRVTLSGPWQLVDVVGEWSARSCLLMSVGGDHRPANGALPMAVGPEAMNRIMGELGWEDEAS